MEKKHILCACVHVHAYVSECITQPILLMKSVQPSHGGLFPMFKPNY